MKGGFADYRSCQPWKAALSVATVRVLNQRIMRASLVLLMLAQLLLRAAAVPHMPAAQAGTPCDSARPHVHVNGHGQDHSRSHAHDHHHSRRVQRGSPEVPSEAPASDHDGLTIYLDAGLILPGVERPTAPTTLDWLVLPVCCAAITTPAHGPQPHHPRPPGDASFATCTFFPHVLRV